MKVRISITRHGKPLFEGEREVFDGRSFGEAFASVWSEMRERRLGRTTSIGDFMDAMDDSELEELDGTQFSLRKL
jgi:hypothetical protein